MYDLLFTGKKNFSVSLSYSSFLKIVRSRGVSISLIKCFELCGGKLPLGTVESLSSDLLSDKVVAKRMSLTLGNVEQATRVSHLIYS